MKYILSAISAILLIIAAVNTVKSPDNVNIPWILAIGLLILSVHLRDISKLCLHKIIAQYKANYTILTILAGGIFLRLYKLQTFPFTVHGDEAEFGIGTREIMAGVGPNLASTGWYNVPLLSFAIPIPAFLIFGDNLFALRFTSVVLGVASIYLTYKLAQLLFTQRVAIYAAFITMYSSLHIHFSRSGTHYMQAVTVSLLSFYFLWSAIKRQNLRGFLFSGLMVGLSLQVYYSARISVVIIAIFGLTYLITGIKHYTKSFKRISLFVTGILYGSLPILVYFINEPNAFVSRTVNVWIYSNIDHLSAAYGTGSISKITLQQFINTLMFFFGGKDMSSQYGFMHGGFDYITSALLFIGIGMLHWNIMKNKTGQFLLIWFYLMLVSIVLTVDAPFSPRILPIIPMVAITAASVLDKIFRNTKSIIIAGILFGIAMLNIYMYFSLYQKEEPRQIATYLSKYLQSKDPTQYNCLLSARDLYYNFGTIRFLNKNAQGETILSLTTNDKLAHCDRLILTAQYSNIYPNIAYDFKPNKEELRNDENYLLFTIYSGPTQ